MNTEELLRLGIDYQRGLKNCMGSPDFYRKILAMFQQDSCFERAEAAYQARDYKALFVCMHELKGTSGNVALMDLYAATVPLVELLRHGSAPDEEVDRLYDAVARSYHRAGEGIALILRS